MKHITGIDLMQVCHDRCELLRCMISDKQEFLSMRIKRNEPYEYIRELKAEIDSMNDELVHVTALHDFYEEKFDGIIF
jgi:hypothetical protein